MPGALDYSLGLGTRSFLGPLAAAQGALAAFTGFAVGAGGVLAGVFSQIERGGELADLRIRTGESVETLFKLQEAFKIVGVDASRVAPTIFQMQKALSGVNESGESTQEIFKRIGISARTLRGSDTIAQLSTVVEKLSKLSKDDATGVAAKIFGRGAAGDILQIARDFKSFTETMDRVDAQARTFNRNASAFDQLGDTLQALKTSGAGFFAEIAAGVSPALQGVLNALQSFDVEGLGKRIGNAFRALTAAFESGQVTELVSLSLAAGFEKAIDVLERSLLAVFAATPDLVQGTLGASIKAVSLTLFASVVNPFADFLDSLANSSILNIAKDSPVGRQTRELASSLRLLGSVAKGEAPRAFGEAAAGFLGAARNGLNAFGEGRAGENEQRLNALIARLVPTFVDTMIANGTSGEGVTLFGGGKAKSDGSADALTRIGFFSGGSTGVTESARATAVATRESAKLLYKINERLERMSLGGNTANV